MPDDFNPGLAERIGATVVTLPPLRDRSGDIPALARHLLARFSEQAGLRPLSIGNDALAVLMRYGWPGNVRQLAGVLFRAGAAMRRQLADRRGFPAHRDPVALQRAAQRSSRRTSASRRATKRSPARRRSPSYRNDGHLRPLEEIEADIIRLAIGHYRGRMTEVARRLGIGRSTLYRKLGELGIDTAA